MKQPSKNIKTSSVNNKPKKKSKKKNKRTICTNTSGLEVYFEENILKQLGLSYQTQFLIPSIGRFYDFYINEENINLIIEIQGNYWHFHPIIYKDKKPNKIQSKNLRVDKIKKETAFKLKFNFIYIWEEDINNKTEEVFIELKRVIEEIKFKNKRDKPIQKTLLFD